MTKLEKFTSLTIHFSSKFDKYSLLYPHLKINFLEQQFHNFQTKFGEISWFEKLAENEGNSTNLKQLVTLSKIVENHLSFGIHFHTKIVKCCFYNHFWNFEFSRKFVFFPFSYFHQKMLSFDFDFGEANSVFVTFADFGIFIKKNTEFQNVFLHLEFSSNFVFSWNFAIFLLRFYWALDISSKLLIITFFERIGDFFKISEFLVFQKSSSKMTGSEHNRHVEKIC